jgi:hypothetical protein
VSPLTLLSNARSAGPKPAPWLTADRIAGQRIFKFSADSFPRFGTRSKLNFAPSARPV